MGRPTKLTDELQKRLVKAIREGHFLVHAAALCGVHRSVVLDWLARGEAEDPPDADERYVDFALAYREAEALAVDDALDAIRDGDDKVAQKGQAWWLERRHPAEYGRRLRAEVTGRDGGPLEHRVTVDPVALAAKINAIADRHAARARAGPGGAGGDPRGAEPPGARGARPRG